MKFTRYRMLLAAAIGVAAVALPVSVPFAESTFGGGAASPSTPAPPDVLTYVQGSGASGTFLQYVPAGNTAGATTQVVTPSGKCATPTVSGTPVLGMSGLLYPPSGYSGSPKPVPVGSYNQHTGVCAFPFPWQIENVPFLGTEGLDFTTLGANSVIGTNRIFSDAQIQIQSEQWWPGAPIPVQLVEYLGGSQVGSVTCKVPAPLGSTITADTATNASCTGSVPVSGFDTVEVEVPQGFTSVSVVGTSTFTLAPQVCGGQSITSTGPVTATLSIPSGGGCQSYTAFTSSTNGTTQNLTYNAYTPTTLTTPYTFTTPWAPQTECQPGDDSQLSPLPECLPTLVSIDGVNFTDQTYCATPTTAVPLCTENKTFNYVSVGGTTETQITETWGSLLDWAVRH